LTVSTLEAAAIEQSRRDGSQMFWAPAGCRRQGDALLAWRWVGYVHGVRCAVVTRERPGAYVVYAAKRYVGQFPWLSDAREAAMFTATEVPFQIIDLVSWLLVLVRREEPKMARTRSRALNGVLGRAQVARSASA
jgi:hypothetical protein